jgi:hypothetical protein
VLTVASFGIEVLANPVMMQMFPQALPTESAPNHSVPVKLLTFPYTAWCVADRRLQHKSADGIQRHLRRPDCAGPATHALPKGAGPGSPSRAAYGAGELNIAIPFEEVVVLLLE